MFQAFLWVWQTWIILKWHLKLKYDIVLVITWLLAAASHEKIYIHIRLWINRGGGYSKEEMFCLIGYILKTMYYNICFECLCCSRFEKLNFVTVMLWKLQGTCHFKMKPFMGFVCAVMLFVVYKTTNLQYQQAEVFNIKF